MRKRAAVPSCPRPPASASLSTARRDLALEQALRRLDKWDALVLDDIGYIQQDRDEMELLFTLLSECYERCRVVITSDLVCSQRDRIFKDPMTTAAAVERLVYHSTILELTGESCRADSAHDRLHGDAPGTDDNPPTTPTEKPPQMPHEGDETMYDHDEE